jgi:hypothetical protein
MGFLTPDFTRRLQNHPALQPGETVRHAGYGLGYGTLALADRALGRMTVRQPDERDVGYRGEHHAATGGADKSGLAATIVGNGVLAVTDRRLLFFPKTTVIGTPKAIGAELPLSRVAGATYKAPMLAVHLADGSTFALHMPRNQQPDEIARLLGPPKAG